MIGRSIARLEPFPRRWVVRLWGYPDIHTRQKWAILWPRLASLPARGVRLLDAGCGRGQWALELAVRRPQWTIVGLDRDARAIAQAGARRTRLGLTNVSFVAADFLNFAGPGAFDVILSVASAHYLATEGLGLELFRTFRQWLRPEGWLLLLGPRRDRSPFVEWLPHPEAHLVFSHDDLAAHCRTSGLSIECLSGCVGRFGVLAKQISWAADGWRLLAMASYPAQWAMTSLDRRGPFRDAPPTLMWLLVARRVADDTGATDCPPGGEATRVELLCSE